MSTIDGYEDLLERLRALRLDGAEPPTAIGQRTRARLLQAAAELFERHGYRRTSTSMVAEAAGTSKASVYAHFSTKAELLFSVLLEERIALYERMAPLLSPEQPPAQRLRCLLERAVVWMPTLPISNLVKAGQPELRAALQEIDPARVQRAYLLFEQIFEWLVRESAPDLPPEALKARVRVLINVLLALPVIADPRRRGDVPLEAYAETLSTILVDGVLSGSMEVS